MSTTGTVRFWLAEQGWGVIDAPETPGGCWAHFSAVAVGGYRSLEAGQVVALEWERAAQDGYSYRAVRAWPSGEVPVEAADDPPGAAPAFSSTLTITFDDEDRGH